MHARTLLLALTTATLASAAPALDMDAFISAEAALSARQLQINLTATGDGERGPSAVYSTRPSIVVPKVKNVQLGDRPYFLIQNMTDSPLKQQLQSCSEMPFRPTQFSISHRGAPLQFPEHTMQGIQAGARHGAGVMECDVTFTKDRELVCRQ